VQASGVTEVRKVEGKCLNESSVQTTRSKESITTMLYVNATLCFPWFLIVTHIINFININY